MSLLVVVQLGLSVSKAFCVLQMDTYACLMLEATVKCCLGDKPWILARVALNPNEDQIDGLDREYLQMLGFMLRIVVDQSVATDE